MSDYDKSCDEILDKLRKFELVLSNRRKKNGYWINFESEIEDTQDNVIKVRFNLLLPKDFPLVLPKIYLDDDSPDELKILPHIDKKNFICTFDSESLPNVNDPFGAVVEVIGKAKQNLYDGLRKSNYDDFKKEFSSYWEIHREKPSQHKFDIVLLNIPSKTGILKSVQSKGNLKISYVYSNNESENRIKAFLQQKNIEYFEHSVLYIDIPYYFENHGDYSNGEVFSIIKENPKIFRIYRKYLQSSPPPHTIFFPIGEFDNISYCGLEHPAIRKIKSDGIDHNYYDYYRRYNKAKFVYKFNVHNMSRERLLKRSGGKESNPKLSFTIAGIGSIGSNLVQLLNGYDFPDILLIDEDYIKIENIGRHLLGFNSVNQNKSEALRDHLLSKLPTQNIESLNDSIVEIIRNKSKVINGTDFLFVAIGNRNIERFVADAQKNGVLNIPIIYLWIEPNLTAGHVVMMRPNSISFDSLFDEEDYFKFNRIATETYLSKEYDFTLREAGCPSIYIPYSLSTVNKYLGLALPYIERFLFDETIKSSVITYVGPEPKLPQVEIAKVKYYHSYSMDQIVIHEV